MPLFKRDPAKKLKRAYQQKMESAMHAMRRGDVRENARLVAEAVCVVSDSRSQYQVHAMGTTLERDLNGILELVRSGHGALRKHADRVLLELSTDDCADAEGERGRSLEHLREVSPSLPLERFIAREGG